MPVVPVDQNRVAPSEGVSARLRSPDMQGTGLEALGRGMQQLGQAGAQYVATQDQIQDHADKLGARDLGLQYQKFRDDLTREYSGLAGKDATDQGALYQQKLADAKKQFLERAGNQRVKGYVGPMIDELALGGSNVIADHSQKQTRVYQDGLYQSGAADAAQSAIQYADNPALFQQHMVQGLQNIAMRLHLNGRDDPNTLKIASLEFKSGVHTGVLDNLLASADPKIDQANAYFDEHKGEMTVAAQQGFLRDIQHPMQARQDDADLTRVTAGGIIAKSGAPTTVASLTTMRAITMQSESAGNPNAVSVKGAVGTMQTMPTTLRDPGFGVRAAANNSPSELERVGNDYLSAMMERYHNDPAKAWAAYNWGPGHVDKAIAENGAGWLSTAPKETRDYVSKNLAQLNGGHSTEVPQEWDKDQTYNKIDATAAKERWSFERTERVKRRADQVIARDEELLNRQQRAAGEQAVQTIIGLGANFTDVNQIPAAVRAKADPVDIARWQEAAVKNRIAKTQVPNDTARSLELQIMARTDPDGFLKTQLAGEVGKVSPDDLKKLALGQADILGKQSKPQAYDPRSGITTAITWGNKYGGVKVADTDFPKVYDAMDAVLQGIYKTKGKVEQADYDHAFKAAVRDLPTTGWLWNGSMKAYNVTTASQIPAGANDWINKHWTGAKPPTEQQRVQLYQQMMANAVR
ncbi:LT_GEWL domain containing protein [uncultured Caudovirales phage]|uniref:LT_GEWL domain containing protein n=1 Tax=uncultured Caudovirales phage TaxID=2100421 RepID=A0A6J5KKP3_9CAUD|nr:LT_GEWL domain containing protein [uncultured Caudovirales phage]